MKSKILLSALILIALCCSLSFAKSTQKGVIALPTSMELTTPDGMQIILNEDKTWVMKSGKQGEIEKDFTVPVSGGKVILISQDKTWSFVDKEIVDNTPVLALDSVVSKGHNINIDISAATDAAQKQALREALEKTKIALKNFKITPAKLADCIKEAEKDVNKKEDFKKGTGWEVSIVITINKVGLLGIAECAKKEAPPAADNKKGKK